MTRSFMSLILLKKDFSSSKQPKTSSLLVYMLTTTTCRPLGHVDHWHMQTTSTCRPLRHNRKSVCSIRTDGRIVKPSKGLLLQTLRRTKSVLSKKLYLLKGLIVLKPKIGVILPTFPLTRAIGLQARMVYMQTIRDEVFGCLLVEKIFFEQG